MNQDARIAAEQIVTMFESGAAVKADIKELPKPLIEALGGLPWIIDNMSTAGIALYILALHLRKAA
jgi:hypothetical protein